MQNVGENVFQRRIWGTHEVDEKAPGKCIDPSRRPTKKIKAGRFTNKKGEKTQLREPARLRRSWSSRGTGVRLAGFSRFGIVNSWDLGGGGGSNKGQVG